MKLYTFIQNTMNPYENLAVEEILRRQVCEGEVILYLWQNKDTVVIGRNQCAYDECNLEAMQKEGVKLARRMSGGGAVYHDEGNLNFSFLACDSEYDKVKQNQVLLDAIQSFGLEASISGRNDLLAEERKFSGHAYYQSDGKNCHHGTLMIGVDQNRLSSYLNVSKAKLQKRSVASVKSRVINLQSLNDEITVETMKEKLIESFSKIYKGTPVPYESLQTNLVQMQQNVLEDKDWLYGAKKNAYKKLYGCFDWGEITLYYRIENERIQDILFNTDGMDASLLLEIPEKLKNIPLDKERVKLALKGDGLEQQVVCDDIYKLIKPLLERK